MQTRSRGHAGWGRAAVLCAIVIVIFAACAKPAWALPELQAGAAKVDITPDVKSWKVPLGGYAARKGAPSTGVHDPVYARAIALSEGDTRIAIVSVDLCFLPANVYSEVLKRVAAAGITGLDRDHVLISATHTHSAPDPLAMHSGNTFTFTLKGWTPFDGKLLDFTAGRIADAIVSADKNRVPAELSSGSIRAIGLNRNRRGEKTTDPALTVLRLVDVLGRPIAAVVNFAAHPTLYDDDMREVSADWPGVTTSEVESALGNASVCLFLNGAEGDASPNGAEGKTDAEKVVDFGHKMALTVEGMLPDLKADQAAQIDSWSQSVTLPERKPNLLFVLAASQVGATNAQARQFVSSLMPQSTRLTFVRVGPVLLMGFPCEPSAELGLAAKSMAAKAGVSMPAVVALSNDWLAYALTPAQYHAGKYEAGMSFYGDQFGPSLLSALATGLAQRHNASRVTSGR